MRLRSAVISASEVALAWVAAFAASIAIAGDAVLQPHNGLAFGMLCVSLTAAVGMFRYSEVEALHYPHFVLRQVASTVGVAGFLIGAVAILASPLSLPAALALLGLSLVPCALAVRDLEENHTRFISLPAMALMALLAIATLVFPAADVRPAHSRAARLILAAVLLMALRNSADRFVPHETAAALARRAALAAAMYLMALGAEPLRPAVALRGR
jgi:hypothetical protein